MNRKWKWMLVLCLAAMLFAAVALGEGETLVAVDQENAVVLLRQQLVARNKNFTLLVPGQSMDQDAAYALYQKALEHTGSPKEGDYLRAHMIDCIPEIGKTEMLGTEYVQLHYVPMYKSTAAMEQEVDAAVETFFATYPVKEKATQYEKIEAVYDYLCDTITYDFARKHGAELSYGEREKENVLIANTAYAGLVEGTCVCEGYASSFYRLMLEMGIDARLVEGMTTEPHAWNIVELDGQYYHLDATWDASHMGWYQYFLQPMLSMHEPGSDFLQTYTIAQEAYVLPEKEMFTSGDYTYSVTYGACIHAYTGQEKDVVVPEKLDGIPVVSAKQTMGVPFESWEIRSLTFPEGFRHFRNICVNCGELQYVGLPSTLVWGSDEFRWFIDTNTLTEIRVAEGNRHIKVIDDILYTMDGETLLACPCGLVADTVVVPDGVKHITAEAFRGCKNIRKVVLPEGLMSIGNSAFESAVALEEINIPSTCETICQWAFGRTAIKELHLPAALTSINGALVEFNTSLQKVTVEEGNKNLFVEDGVLYYFFIEGYNNLMIYPSGLEQKTFVLPDHVTYIAAGAFNNAQFEEIVFNDGLICINNEAFYMCNNLKEITTPPSVEAIWDGAFWDCMNIETFTMLNDQIQLEEHSFGHYYEIDGKVREKPLLRGHAGSTIETFAKTYDFPFEAIE